MRQFWKTTGKYRKRHLCQICAQHKTFKTSGDKLPTKYKRFIALNQRGSLSKTNVSTQFLFPGLKYFTVFAANVELTNCPQHFCLGSFSRKHLYYVAVLLYQLDPIPMKKIIYKLSMKSLWEIVSKVVLIPYCSPGTSTGSRWLVCERDRILCDNLRKTRRLSVAQNMRSFIISWSTKL